MTESLALIQFRSSLQIAEELMRIERNSYGNPPKLAEQRAVEGLRGGAAVLMVAGFERFLRRSVEEHLATLTTKPFKVPFDELPAKMKVHSVFTTLEHALKGAPYEAPRKKIDRLADIEDACKAVLSGSVNPQAFSSTGGNPSAGTVKEMYSLVGITDVFGKIKPSFEARWKKPEAHTFIMDKLNEIVNRRHVIAHTADALKVGRSDLREATRFLEILAESLDEEIEKYVADLIN